MLTFAESTNMKNHVRFQIDHGRVIPQEKVHRAMHRARNLEDTREMSRPQGWVPNWDKIVSERKSTTWPPPGPPPAAIEKLRKEAATRRAAERDPRSRWHKFKDRFNTILDWFTLSAIASFFAVTLLAGGILAAKGLIILWQEVLSVHIG